MKGRDLLVGIPGTGWKRPLTTVWFPIVATIVSAEILKRFLR